jgi:hypothetical protein
MPSRRTLLGVAGASALAVTSGCTALGSTGDGNGAADRSTSADGTEDAGRQTSADGNGATSRRTTDDGDPAFEVRLRGPGIDRTLFDEDDVAAVGTVRERRGAFGLPVTLTDGATATVGEAFRTAGVDDSPDEFDVVMVLDGDTSARFGVAPGLAAAVADGEWDGRLLLRLESRETATAIRETLAEGRSDAGARRTRPSSASPSPCRDVRY